MQPPNALPGFWIFMYRVSPLTYLISGLTSTGLHARAIECAPEEMNVFNPPSGQTCGEYMAAYLQAAPGTLHNPSATSGCQYCALDNADQYLAGSNICTCLPPLPSSHTKPHIEETVTNRGQTTPNAGATGASAGRTSASTSWAPCYSTTSSASGTGTQRAWLGALSRGRRLFVGCLRGVVGRRPRGRRRRMGDCISYHLSVVFRFLWQGR
jgi:hypothetical protein